MSAQLTLHGPTVAGAQTILTPEALAFVGALVERFGSERESLLQAREKRQVRLDGGELPAFLPETQSIREGEWRVASIPADLLDRRVEITGPVDRKMIINALNSGAKMFMADFEDSTSPTWQNLLEGQINLYDAVRGTISLDTPEGKSYRLNDSVATLLVRPRGWHLPEAHVRWGGEPISGSLFDFGMFVFHNAASLLEKGSGPYFYLPKLEGHEEARLWNAVIDFSEDWLGLNRGTVKCTVLIETLLASFEMDEILFELKDHIVGLNCGRWDYIFSYIRALGAHPDRVLPERAQVGMTAPFLRAYSQLLIHTCHRRGAFAMGGMAAQIPIKHDAQANAAALAKVRADKEREAADGHDGTWVAHPALIPIAMEIFDKHMPGPNQLTRHRDDVVAEVAVLLEPAKGTISEAGVRANINVALQYVAAWLGGMGCVPIHHLMEDAATAEISRAQLWQWRKHNATMADGQHVRDELIEKLLKEELAALLGGDNPLALRAADLSEAQELLRDMVFAENCPTFLTLPAYDRLLAREGLATL